MKQIFPKEIIDNTTEVHQFKHSTKSSVIYSILLFAFLGILIALPFLKVDVYSSARGIIKPDKDRIDINVINSGRIIYSTVQNNIKVNKGDTLLVIDNNGIDERIVLSNYQFDETALFVKDLSILLEKKSIQLNELKSSKYKRLYLQYTQKYKGLEVKLIKTKRDFQRHSSLFEKNVISISEFENKKLEYDLAKNELNQFGKQQLNFWQADLIQYENQLKEIKSNEEQLLKSKKQYIVTAPIKGTLLNIKPQELGSFIALGTRLGEISPDTDLLVECYVSPIDIGLLKKKDEISFQVDAFNYNQWGLATGEILEMGKDVEFIEKQPVFKVRCKMHQKYLTLKNGFKGNLKKGMTLNANFRLTERTLYDLLYDKMDDWLNPSRNYLAQY